MKQLLVCMKAVPVSAQVGADPSFRLKREEAGLQWNVADEAALEAALRLTDHDGAVTVLAMGPAKLESMMTELLARGAKRALLITDGSMAGADTHATAKALAQAVKKYGPFEAIFCGCKAMDGETGQVPGELAAALELPCVSHVEGIESSGDTLRLSRRLENGVQRLAAKAPLVVSFCPYTYPLRLPGILGMRAARKIPVEIVTAKALGLLPEECGRKGSLTQVQAMQTRFPGLRNGKKETDLSCAITGLSKQLREVLA